MPEPTAIDKAIEAKLGAVMPTASMPRSGPKVVEPIEIVLDRPRTMRLDFRGMKAFHTLTGLSPWGAEAWTDPSPDILLSLIWASLIHEDPTLTLTDVEAMPNMDMANMAYLTERIGMLWGNAMPDPAVATNGATADPNPKGPKTPPTG